MSAQEPPNGSSWFERPATIRGLIAGLVVLCAALALADLGYSDPHASFQIENSFAFFAWCGFLAFVGIVFLGRLLRRIVSRPEDYYHDDDC